MLRGEAIEIDGPHFDPKDAALKAAAEHGRSKTNRYEHLPYVNHTEAWAGLVLRRLMQRAAGDPEVEQFAWITEAMRNGGRSGGGSLAQFYQVILPKIVDKIIKPAGGKVEMGEVVLKAGTSFQAPQFKMMMRCAKCCGATCLSTACHPAGPAPGTPVRMSTARSPSGS